MYSVSRKIEKKKQIGNLFTNKVRKFAYSNPILLIEGARKWYLQWVVIVLRAMSSSTPKRPI